MIFNTAWFLGYFAVFYTLFLLIPGKRLRLYFTLACSALFQVHFAGSAGVAPILVMAVATYFAGIALGRLAPSAPHRKLLYFAALSVPVLGLLGYKYRGLILGSLSPLLGPSLAAALKPYEITPALPLGLSFFTFEFVHYLTDVYHGSKPVKGPVEFGIFSVFFPSIVSGPIKRYQDFLGQLKDGWPECRSRDAAEGLRRIVVGYFKKLVIADNATMMVRLIEGKAAHSASAAAALMALLSIRILFDFSGYSDIAIGLGRMLGVKLPENFNYPYIAGNISDFWNRWHMSLSTWIRDYIYIPLGGNRHGLARKFANLLLAMFLCGLWHGAAWHFGLWGIYNGIGLAAHGIWEKTALRKRLVRSPVWGVWCVGFNNVFVAYGWLMFFYPLSEVVRYTRALFGGG